MRSSMMIAVLFAGATSAATAHAGGPTATEKNRVSEPAGWNLAGDEAEAYTTASDKAVKHGGGSSARLSSPKVPGKGFGTLMQSISAKKYRGKRVQLAAWLKTEKLASWAGLWMRVDGKGGGTLAFDNMQDRAVKGTTEWTRYTVVLDVDKTAESISFGTLLVEAGTLWIDDAELQVVAKSVATTLPAPATLREAPLNLAFED